MSVEPKTDPYDVIIVGAGISGINAAYRVQTQVQNAKYTILEARDAMGGTWDLFRYPGIRSDSDLHTFGFPFRPWNEQKTIAEGDKIRFYINDTAREFGIDRQIQYRHKLISSNWSSDSQTWSLKVDADGEEKTFNTRFIIYSTGYYDYDHALPATIPGLENFKGTVVHPQWWPEDLDYSGKRIVIIGSGATAVTLLPVLGQDAASVTMLQRSPGYLLNLPGSDPSGIFLSKWLPSWLAFKLVRWKFLILPFIFFNFCRSYPNVARQAIKRRTGKELPKNIPHDPHFEPKYNPWEQRMCIAPDGDFYKALREGKADIATGHIKTVTENGIELESGQKLDADIIVTATGLKIQVVGGSKISVDNEPIVIPDKFMWKGMMLQDVPNATIVLGYTNASWTLGADTTAQHTCRIINHLRKTGATSAAPKIDDPSTVKANSILNLNSTYVQKAKGTLPKAGDTGPWRPRSNYFADMWRTKFGNLTSGLQISRVST